MILFGLAYSCDVLEPESSNVYDIDDVKSVVTYAEGVLIKAYRNIPTSHNNFNLSYASDDAVNNDQTSDIKTVVSGGWSSNMNPFSQWNTAYESILYINTFLEEMNEIEWYWKDQITSENFANKLKGEAYALRAWNYFHLLQAHAGMGVNGEMLGVPIVNKVLNINDKNEYQIHRSSFNELVKFIIDDCDRAIDILPPRWKNTGNSRLDIAIGERNTNRINGLVARLIKAKTILYAASPAYTDGTYTYEMAALAAADIIDLNNGLDDVFTGDVEFYNNPDVPNLGNRHPEVFWYTSRQNNANSWELSNFPPSLYGRGLTNPTQNLVNSFPNLDGTPVTNEKINSSNPYSNRDPRLEKFILFNGTKFTRGGSTVVINTTFGSQDALGSTDVLSSKTGYYLRKFMNVRNVNLDPRVNVGGMRYYTYARYTDALLIFAEAANESVGPDTKLGNYTAKEVINAIRNRAGITSNDYVNSLNKEQMRNVIQNERRIEMCFEGQRFWDLRRWKEKAKINEPVYGVQVSAEGDSFDYFEVEKRIYPAYQIYGPIPYIETLKYDIIQNSGW